MQSIVNRSQTLWVSMLLLGIVMIAGCGSSQDKWTKQRPKVYKASGVVKYKDAPVEHAIILYQSGDQTAHGLTDAQGKFVLTTFSEGDGAIAGTHKVSIRKTVYEEKPTKFNSDEEKSVAKFAKELLPVKYLSTENSGLTAEVTSGGKNMQTFELQD